LADFGVTQAIEETQQKDLLVFRPELCDGSSDPFPLFPRDHFVLRPWRWIRDHAIVEGE